MIDNKTVLIIGLVCGGLFSIYANQFEIASAIFGGLVGYLSKDTITVRQEAVDGSDLEEA